MKVSLPNPPFVDERGTITNLTTTGCQSVAVITSKAGSIRARHIHPDEHTTYVISGKVHYSERFRGGGTGTWTFGPGDFFHTRGGVDHAMVFEEDSVIVTIATGVRDTDTHEAGLVRTEWPELEKP